MKETREVRYFHEEDGYFMAKYELAQKNKKTGSNI
jgi:hypothetical protein